MREVPSHDCDNKIAVVSRRPTEYWAGVSLRQSIIAFAVGATRGHSGVAGVVSGIAGNQAVRPVFESADIKGLMAIGRSERFPALAAISVADSERHGRAVEALQRTDSTLTIVS